MSQDLAVSSTSDGTLDLATFFTNLKYEDVPENVMHMAKASVLNSIGCGLSSAILESSKKAFDALDVTSKEPRPATILARPERATVDDAALLNGLSMTARFFDDTHIETVVHPSGPPLAAVLAYAEANHMSGREVLLAFLVGVETMLIVASALGLGPYKKGWHLTSITGTFGATAAVAKLIGLNTQQTAVALGHASSMASGSRGVFATDTLIMHAGRAAQNGILAARLAQKGFGSTSHALEKYVNLISTGDSDSSLIGKLSSVEATKRKWMILDNAFKPYPCGIVIHPIIDAGIEAHHFFFGSGDSPIGDKRPQDALDVLARKKIEVTVTPLTVRLCGVQHPAQFMQTLFSTYHGFAVGLMYGKGGINEFSADAANESTIKALRDRIVLKTDESLADNQASVRFQYGSTTGGEDEKTFFIKDAIGSLSNPMSDKQLEEKFLDQSEAGHVDHNNAVEALEELWALEHVKNIGGVMKLLIAKNMV